MEKVDYQAKVKQSVEKEFEDFKANMLAQDKEEIFLNHYRIHAYSEFRYFLCEVAGECDQDAYDMDRIWEALYRDAGGILCLLWDYYIDTELTSTECFEDTYQTIRSYCYRYFEDIMNRKEDGEQ